MPEQFVLITHNATNDTQDQSMILALFEDRQEEERVLIEATRAESRGVSLLYFYFIPVHLLIHLDKVKSE